MTDRYVVVGAARSRQGWFAELSRWSTAAVAPIDYLKCLDPAEVLALLGSGRRVSALLLDAGLAGVDRELFAVATSAGAAVVVVDDGRTRRDWDALGAAAVLDPRFDRTELMEVLGRHARFVDRDRAARRVVVDATERGRQAPVVSVTGLGGAGVSTVAMATAQVLVDLLGGGRRVALVDGARRGSLAMYHDTGDVLPGLPELVEAHRHDELDPTEVTRLLVPHPRRGYDVLLGVRRPRDLVAMRPAALAAALDSLTRCYDVVVVEHDRDLDGEAETGSVDIEELHGLARLVSARADLVLAVGRRGLAGVQDHLHLLDELEESGIHPRRIQPVVNRAPRGAPARAAHTRTMARLAGPPAAQRRAPLFLGRRRSLEEHHHRGERLPDRWTRPLATLVPAALAEGEDPVGARPAGVAESRIRPGDLGTAVRAGREVA